MQLTDEDKRVLAETARASLKAAVEGVSYAVPATGSPALLEKRGCFVTLRTGGNLRGCLGCFVSDKTLIETVAEYSRHSALDDPRFAGRRITKSELPDVEMDISALSPLERCLEPEKIVPGVHGIYVRSGGRSGCFLPQVATEQGWTVDEFWGYCCKEKAGLEWDAWRRPGVELMTFTADVFDC